MTDTPNADTADTVELIMTREEWIKQAADYLHQKTGEEWEWAKDYAEAIYDSCPDADRLAPEEMVDMDMGYWGN